MLTVIVPSCGRESLTNTLTSISKQERSVKVEVIVVGDGAQPRAQEIVKNFPKGRMKVRYLSHGPTRNYGNDQRTFAQGISHGSHIVYLDDDDILAPEAFKVITKALKREPTRDLFIFRCVSPWGEVVWTQEGVFEQGNLCTIQLVARNPRPQELLPPWPLRQGGNVKWTQMMSQKVGGASWRPEIISIARPREEDLWWQS